MSKIENNQRQQSASSGENFLRLRINLQDDAINVDKFSVFDNILIREWKKAMDDGLFIFKINDILPFRYLSGKYSFVVQLNKKRVSEKRPTEIKETGFINQPYDEKKFNFTKIKKTEILFEMEIKNDNVNLTIPKDGQITDESNDSRSNKSYIIINNSPIDLGHVLLVPRLYSGINQILNMNAVELANKVILCSNSHDLLIGFNSINAHASINHLHLHAYYLNSLPHETNKFKFSVQNITTAKKIAKNLWLLDHSDYFFPGFSLQLSDFDNNLDQFERHILLITDYLVANNMPHNVSFTKAPSYIDRNISAEKIDTKLDNVKNTIRVVIWPKKAACLIPKNEKEIYFAVCELSGHFIIANETDFDELNESDILKLVDCYRLDEYVFLRIQDDLKAIFNKYFFI